MKVLIAEDDPISRRLLQSHAEKWGHEVVTAENGAVAWRLFTAGDFPLVITDWMMPEMDGLELIRNIRASSRSHYVYVILLTALTQKSDIVRGLEAGADDYVTKPFDRDELRVRVRAGERIIRLEEDLAEQNRVLRETQAALYQSEKLASLGQLAAGVAHEINNPIAYVTNNLAVVRRDVRALLYVLNAYRQGRASEAARPEDDADLAFIQEHLSPLIDKSIDGLGRVREIVKNLREFARLDEAEFKEVNLNDALLSTIEILRHAIKEKEIRLETRLAELPIVACHPGKVNQVFLNLLLNAVQACDLGGRIEVRTRPEGPEAVVVEVEDNGCGIREEHLPHIFEPFFTTKPVGQGTGLGLSVSYAIVREHGGQITVRTEPDRGSTFAVRLPRKDGTENRSGPEAPRDPK